MKTCIEQIKNLYSYIKNNGTTEIQRNRIIKDLLKTNSYECVIEGQIVDIDDSLIRIKNSCLDQSEHFFNKFSCFNLKEDNINVSFYFDESLKKELNKYKKGDIITLQCILINLLISSDNNNEKLSFDFWFKTTSILKPIDNFDINNLMQIIEKNKIPQSRFQNRINEIIRMINDNEYKKAKLSLISDFQYKYFEPKTYRIKPYEYFDNELKGTLKFHILFEKNCLPLILQNEDIVNEQVRLSYKLPNDKTGLVSFIIITALLLFFFVLAFLNLFYSDDLIIFKFFSIIVMIITSSIFIIYLNSFLKGIRYTQIKKRIQELEKKRKITIAKIKELCNDNIKYPL